MSTQKVKKGKHNFKKGSALAETILIVAISLVLIVVIFYPQIKTLFETLMQSMSTWFSNAISVIGATS